MSDDKSKQGYQDDSKIANDEFSYWCKKWNITNKELRAAIRNTKSHAVSVVEKYLRDNGKIK